MRPGWLGAAVVALAALPVSGCAVLLVGTGVAAGLAVADDTVQTDLERSPQTVYRIAKQELERAGKVVFEDSQTWALKAQVDHADVAVTISVVGEQVTRLRVKARKNLLPDMDVAHRLSMTIGKRL